MKLNLSLRLKVTLINTMVLIVCSLILTISTYFSTSKSIDLLSNTYPSALTQSKDQFEPSKNIPAQTVTEAAKIEKTKLATTSTIYMILVIGLGCIITYLTTSKSLESVKKLNNEIKDISEHNLSQKIKEDGPNDEIKDLTKSFNNMLSRIDSAFESQKQFSSNVAHELRTPLAVIQMKIDVFKKNKNPKSEEYDKLINIIEKNNNRLSKVVEELLSISNKDNIEFKDKINFDKIINSITNELKFLAIEKNINIYFDEKISTNKSKVLYGNEQLLYRAIYNLVENSIKYNYENGYVKIDLNKESEIITITIEDSGIGINEKDYENIFKPFYRVDKSRSRKIGGSGLGLSIVKTIINQHNGKINVEDSVNGSKFIIKIPYS